MTLKKDESILKTIRVAVGLSEDSTDFDTDLLIHINSAVSKLRQNGVDSLVTIVDDETTWVELEDPMKIVANQASQMFPLYITLSTKIIFDPPPPSTVEYYSKSIDELLWRIKIAYETMPI